MQVEIPTESFKLTSVEQLYRTGTLAQIQSIAPIQDGIQVCVRVLVSGSCDRGLTMCDGVDVALWSQCMLLGHRRIRITDVISTRSPFSVQVSHLWTCSDAAAPAAAPVLLMPR
jgi:hypothetical protein